MDRRILVVDDDPVMLKLLSKYLTAEQYEVLSCASGEEALHILHREGPAILLSDWSMPGINGLDLCRAIRSNEAIGFVYIIMVTAQSDKECVVQALEAGANDFIAKPFHRQELTARVNAGMRIITLKADLMRQRRELHKINAELSILNSKLERMATTDELTGLANRREAMRQLRNQWNTSIRYNQPLSCIMMDIDHFKKCNDTYGHDMGDLLLKKSAEILASTSRASDFVCRLGGEEFLVLCPNTNGAAAVNLAERYRQALADNEVVACGHRLKVTISAGVAARTPSSRDCEEQLKQADRALYHAKHTGRNKVVFFSEELVSLTELSDLADVPV